MLKQEINSTKWARRRSIKEYEKSITMEAKMNPKAFYAHARSKMTKRDGIADLIDPSGATASTDEEKAKVINEFFNSVFTVEDTANMPEF